MLREMREQRISKEDVNVYLQNEGIANHYKELTTEQRAALRFEIKVNPEKIRYAESERRHKESGRTLDELLKDLY